jgi:hypothetical protein
MNAKRLNILMLAGCQIVILGGMMPRLVPAADPASATAPVHQLQLAQQEFFPSKWPGKDTAQSASQNMTGPGGQPPMGQGMMGPGMGPPGRGMMGPGMGPPGQGMMGPGMGSAGQGMMNPGTASGSQSPMGQGTGPAGQGMMGPFGRGMMGPGVGPTGQSMMKSGTASGNQSPLGQGMMPAPAMMPRGPGMPGGPMGGSPMAMLGAIGTLDLSDEQRGKYDAINQDLHKRMQEIADRMNTESEKLRKLQEEQMNIGRTLNDLRGHMLQATLDAANRAEELLTDDQRRALINQGGHVMMQPRTLPYSESQGGKNGQP